MVDQIVPSSNSFPWIENTHSPGSQSCKTEWMMLKSSRFDEWQGRGAHFISPWWPDSRGPGDDPYIGKKTGGGRDPKSLKKKFRRAAGSSLCEFLRAWPTCGRQSGGKAVSEVQCSSRTPPPRVLLNASCFPYGRYHRILWINCKKTLSGNY